MAGLGRGGRGVGLLQALSEKKKREEEEAMEARAREQMRMLKLKEEEEGALKREEAMRKEKEQLEIQERQRLEQVAKEAELAKAEPKPSLKGLGRGGMLASLVKNKTALGSQLRRISPTEEIEPKKSPSPPLEKSKLPSKLFSMGRGLRLAKSGGETMPLGKTSPTQLRISPVAEVKKEVTQPQVPVVEVKKEEIKAELPVEDKSKSVKTSSIEKAADEVKIEHILRQSPVRKVGDSGQQANFCTNYIKLKCKNKGVYQYVVHFDPPVDNQHTRVKLLYHCSEVTGPVRLFDGHTLFLPVLLKDKITTIKARAKTDTSDVTLKIQLTKILPPEQIPPTVFNIIFKKYKFF